MPRLPTLPRTSLLLACVASAALAAQPTLAQTSLFRTTITGIPPFDNGPGKPEPADPPHPGVVMTAGDMRITFDSWYGGTPRLWHLFGDEPTYTNSIIHPHMGEAMQVIYDCGQDSTQGTCNGTAPHPIAMIGDQESQKYKYYIRENVFQPPSQQDPRAIYRVSGHAPFFWVSHEPAEDCIPGDPPSSGWCTSWNNNPDCGTCDGDWCKGLPVAFAGKQGRTSGILMLGNQYECPGGPCVTAWNKRLCRIEEGRVAFKVAVDLSQGSADSFVAIMFRRQVTDKDGATIDDAYLSAGYFLALNHAGGVQLLRSNGAGAVDLAHDFGIVAPLAGSKPVVLEARTDNGLPGEIQVFVDGKFIDAWSDGNPVLGVHFGLFASTGPGTRVRFFDRQVFDLGTEFVSIFTGYPDGSVVSDITIQNGPKVKTPRKYYPAGAPVAYIAYYDNPFAQMRNAAVMDAFGNFEKLFIDASDCSAECDVPNIQFNPSMGKDTVLISCTLRSPHDAATHWIGDNDYHYGLWMTPLLAEINDAPAPSPHSFVQVSSQALHFQAAVTAQPFIQVLLKCGTLKAMSFRTVTQWSNRHNEAEMCYADINADGALDLFDFLAFTNLFNAHQKPADCDQDAAYDLFDFLCFTNAFNAGC